MNLINKTNHSHENKEYTFIMNNKKKLCWNLLFIREKKNNVLYFFQKHMQFI